jgi:hypothetical protein
LSLTFSKSCDDHVLAANAKATAFPGTLTLQEGKLTAHVAAIFRWQVITEQGTDTNNRIEAIEALSGMVEHDPRIRPLLAQLSHSEQDSQVRGAAESALAGLE